MGCPCCWNGTHNGEENTDEKESMMLKGKKIIAIGERDGVASPAIAACVQAAGGEVVLSATECFV